MAGIFGTDGVRARINTGPMRAESVVRLALAAGRWFVDHIGDSSGAAPLVVIGKDTRLSGYMLESALVAGFSSIGMECRLLGPIPTATVSMMTQSLGAHLGVMISASHNPHYDNGIKLFGPDGKKLDDNIELEISQLMQGSIALAEAEDMGRVRRILETSDIYVENAVQTVTGKTPFAGLKVVVDCANGAAYMTAPKTLTALGADVICLHNTPDGLNINENCGAVHPQAMAKAVVAHGADLGIALDGDADRLILADETGLIHDGDKVLAVIASAMKQAGTLRGAVVGTLMSNLGLERFLKSQDIAFARAKVGDRYILQMLDGTDADKGEGGNLGGENSGHILMPDLIASGDGLIAALQVISAKVAQDKPMSDILGLYEPVPQKLVNLPDMDKRILDDDEITSLVADLTEKFAGEGRILLRPSGTENLIRVMVEATDEVMLTQVIDRLVHTLSEVNQRYTEAESA
ncbi:MAG: phosphoglucosamine mutase [Candidatus Puniceispirillaceae bacterium]